MAGSMRGQRHPRAKYTDQQVHQWRELHRNGRSINSLAKEVGTNSGYMSLLIRGKRRARDAEPVEVIAHVCGETCRTAHSRVDVAMEMGITIQAVEQIEMLALAKLRAEIQRRAVQADCSPMQWLFGDE